MPSIRHLMVALLLCAAPALAATPEAAATQALHALFDSSWQAGAERYPEWSTYRGDYRYNGPPGQNRHAAAGQALAYMIGQLKIIELRNRASARLGPRFDIRRFHNAVIDNGALPLTTLEALIDEWIGRQQVG